MKILNNILSYLLSFESYVLIPIILLVLSLFIGMKLNKALKSVLTIGIGFVGLGLIFGYFMETLSPVVEAMILRMGLQMQTMDVGWTPFAMATWSADFAGLGLILILAANIIMLLLKWTKTMNIDIFNYWHMMCVGVMVQLSTGSIALGLISSVIASMIVLKLSDYIGHDFEVFSQVESVTTTTLSAVTYAPIGYIMGWLLDRVPFVKHLDADAKTIKKKFGLLGEPIVLGCIIGFVFGIAAGYDAKSVLELGVQFAAIIYLFPKVAGALGEGLRPISESMSRYIERHFPKLGKIYIGVDIAIILGNPSIIVTGLILIPVAIGFSLILPGIDFIILGDLTIMMVLSSIIVVVNRGSIIRSLMIAIPIVISNLYIATYMAPYYTKLVHGAEVDLKGYDGRLTSMIDGGNHLRYYIFGMFNGSFVHLLLIPVIILCLYLTYRLSEYKT